MVLQQQFLLMKKNGGKLIIRRADRSRYTIIHDALAQDNRLSYRARGVMLYLLSHSDNWVPKSVDIAANSGKEGREACRKAMAELEQLGYLVRKKRQKPNGHWVTESWIIEHPEDETQRRPEAVDDPDSLVPDLTEAQEPVSGAKVLANEPEFAKRLVEPGTGIPTPGKPNAGIPVPLLNTENETIEKEIIAVTKNQVMSSTETLTLLPALEQQQSVKPHMRRDALWDAVMQACAVEAESITKSARGAYNAAVGELRALGVDPAEVLVRGNVYRAIKFPGVPITPTALVRHWAECAADQRHLPNKRLDHSDIALEKARRQR